MAERRSVFRPRRDDLRRLEHSLERSSLAREVTYAQREMSERMRAWLRDNRSPAAEHWNLLTDLKLEHLPHAEANPGTVAQPPP